MLQIRKKVFETNSSSTHSFTYDTTGKELTNEELKEKFEQGTNNVFLLEGNLIINLGEFGWEWETLKNPDEKISYILTMIKTNILDNDISDDKYDYMSPYRATKEIEDKIENEIISKLKETTTFKIIESLFKEIGLCFDDIKFENLKNSYVDHESVVNENVMLKRYLKNDVIGFIKNEGSFIQTGNDNYGPYEDY